MERHTTAAGLLSAAALFSGLVLLGYLLSTSTLTIQHAERTVAVKGLSEREVPADVAIWPIKFFEVENELTALYNAVQSKTDRIVAFLKENGFTDDEISVAPPKITDRIAEAYQGNGPPPFRYAATVVITVYTRQVEGVRAAMTKMVDLGKQGIAMVGEDYETRTEFLFNGLNDIKPAMIEEATKNARAAAEKFAKDSDSVLGKIKEAQQGQFSIDDRDSNTPHIKRVRVVSTVVYYLSD
jgi:hypothetical protein